ncbi:uncharacterized protein LOC110715270 [Chenopodium quinoa]|uniref:uncharacterized protein LOC110715270 n=1 Tax=Chenopodium quinoa TaxID=63459 RepID=UPI000B786C98|nr:uncharacterized protein LOC110715270 [Chenopodium quinoa]
MGNTSLQPPPQHQTPTEFPLENYDNEERTPVTDHGSNTQFDDIEEENVPETPLYPPQVPRMQSNQVAARATRVWSVAEDEALIGLYLQISENAIKSTNQKAADLWRNVHAAYQMAQAEKPNILPPRPMKSLLSHWRRLAADTLQWISCYDEAGRLLEGGSGYNEADRVKSASKLFHLATGHNFSFPHAVEMLNKDPKWRPKLRWSLLKEERKAQYAVFDEVLDGRAPLAAARKDVERAFGVLQARFAIIRKPSLAYDEDIPRDIMKACIIMHNMIVEDERHNYTRAEVLRSFYEEDQ